MKLLYLHNRLRFSMSMGIYAFNTSLTFDEAFKEADEALYHSKRMVEVNLPLNINHKGSISLFLYYNIKT